MPDTPTPSPGERTVADVMSRPVVTAQPAETVAVAAQRIRDKRVGSVVVIDHDDRAIGILTERDMIRLAAAGSDASSAKVSEWMTGDPDTIAPDVEARATFAASPSTATATSRWSRRPVPRPATHRSSSASSRCATSCASP